MQRRAEEATRPGFSSILAPFWEPKWAPELIGDDIWRRHFKAWILKPIKVDKKKMPDAKMSGFGSQNGSEIGRKLRSDFVGSENGDFLKSELFL